VFSEKRPLSFGEIDGVNNEFTICQRVLTKYEYGARLYGSMNDAYFKGKKCEGYGVIFVALALFTLKVMCVQLPKPIDFFMKGCIMN
jgi:hypothetical protein